MCKNGGSGAEEGGVKQLVSHPLHHSPGARHVPMFQYVSKLFLVPKFSYKNRSECGVYLDSL